MKSLVRTVTSRSLVLLVVLTLGGCSPNADSKQPSSASDADHTSTQPEGATAGAPHSTAPADSVQPADTGRRVPPGVDTGNGCGGFLGDTCKADEFCAYEPGQHCGAADASATCKPRPSMCTKDYRPVCGCDNKTYSNACSANAAGQGVLSLGECAANP